MKMFKKAQAAMEFLMTYGWAILVVLAAIGALAYFGVLSPGNLLPQKCEFSSGIDCTETPTADATTLRVALTNSNGYDIVYTGSVGTVSSEDGSIACNTPSIADKDLDGTWENGESAIVTFTCGTMPDSGKRFKGLISFNYTSASTNMPHFATGTVAGKVA